jgi:hypothetical protein
MSRLMCAKRLVFSHPCHPMRGNPKLERESVALKMKNAIPGYNAKQFWSSLFSGQSNSDVAIGLPRRQFHAVSSSSCLVGHPKWNQKKLRAIGQGIQQMDRLIG